MSEVSHGELSCFVCLYLSICTNIIYLFLFSQHERQEKRSHAQDVFGSLDHSQDDMGAARRGRFCNEWFGRRKGSGQMQLSQHGQMGRTSQMLDMGYAAANVGGGGGGYSMGHSMGHSQRSSGYSTAPSFVMRDEDGGGDGHGRRGYKKARKEKGKRNRDEEEEISQELIVHEGSSADDSSVTG